MAFTYISATRLPESVHHSGGPNLVKFQISDNSRFTYGHCLPAVSTASMDF